MFNGKKLADFLKDFEKKVFDSLLCTVDGAGDACGERTCIGSADAAVESQLVNGVAVEDLQKSRKFLRAFHTQACFYRNRQGSVGEDFFEKPI